MREKLAYIEMSGERYPIKFDLNALEAVQDDYGSLSAFERELMGYEKTGQKNEKGEELYRVATDVIDIKTFRYALLLMINEGIDMENYLEHGDKKHLTQEDLNAVFQDASIFEVRNALHDEYMRCFVSKNPKSTQGRGKSRS